MGMDWDPEGDSQRRREGRVRMVGAIGITAGLLALVAIKITASHERDRDERALEMARSLDLSTHQDPLLGGELDHMPATTTDELEATSRQVCQRLLECSGLAGSGGSGGSADEAQLAQCIANQDRPATDSFARDLIVLANKNVLRDCGGLACDQFATCYMDSLKRTAGEPTTAKPVDPELEKKFVALVCVVAKENAGQVPDLSGPAQSPKMHELQDLMRQIDDVGEVADLMKRAIATCQ